MKRCILIHGGAGRVKERDWMPRKKGLKEAALSGYDKLVSEDDSLKAVVEAVAFMEDSGLFNAGRGSTLSYSGNIEVDAAVMNWRGEFGGVGGVPNIRNPVKFALYVMRHTPHRFLVGMDAKNIAHKLGYGEYSIDELTGISKIERYLKALGKRKGYYSEIYEAGKRIFGDTVGAVALNSVGELAAAVSTGGLMFKLPGRVGDSPIIGAGIMVDQLSAAVATGIGEYIMDSLLTFRIVHLRRSMSLEAACRKGISFLSRKFGKDTAGVICLDRFGNVGWIHNTNTMGVAYMADGFETPRINISGESFFKL